MAPKSPQIPGFKALSDQVFESEETFTASGEAASDHPHAVLIFGWGDALPKHIVKYSEGYRNLYPHAKQIIVLSPILKAVWSELSERSRAMRPVIESIFGSKHIENGSRILLHCMSNAGGINCASALHEYQEQFGKPLPHQLLVLDSTPGNPYLTWSVLGKWSRAMALGTASYFPWPFKVTQGIWAIFLGVHRLFERLVGRESASIFSIGAINDDKYERKSAQRLYLYSKEDDLIGFEDIEKHAAEGKQHGYVVDRVMFEGSNHVGHMRLFPEKYWSAIQEAWKKAVSGSV